MKRSTLMATKERRVRVSAHFLCINCNQEALLLQTGCTTRYTNQNLVNRCTIVGTRSTANPRQIEVMQSELLLGTGTRTGYPFNTRYPGTRQIPGYPGITQYPCYFFHKVRDTLFFSDNLNTTARAVDALHLHHKAGIPGWVPFPGVAACASHE